MWNLSPLTIKHTFTESSCWQVTEHDVGGEEETGGQEGSCPQVRSSAEREGGAQPTEIPMKCANRHPTGEEQKLYIHVATVLDRLAEPPGQWHRVSESVTPLGG